MVRGHTTKNSPDLDEQRLVQRLVLRGIEMLSADDDIWVAMDSSDLRKPYATKMPDLMDVRALDGALVPGYRVITGWDLRTKNHVRREPLMQTVPQACRTHRRKRAAHQVPCAYCKKVVCIPVVIARSALCDEAISFRREMGEIASLRSQ